MKSTVNARGKGIARRTALGLLGIVVFLSACNSGLEPQLPTADLAPQAASCLTRSGKRITLSGTYRNSAVVARQRDARVDARNARMLEQHGSFLGIKNSGSFCMTGGVVDIGLSLSASWDAYHSSHGPIFYDTPNASIENLTVVNAGDCMSFKDRNPNWVFRDSYLKNCGDDFIEDDRYSGGTVDNVLVDATFMGVSCRAENKGSPRSYTVNVKNSLIAMSARRSAYLWKVTFGGSNKCKIRLDDNVILLTKETRYIDPAQHPKVTTNPLVCSGKSTIVYTGGSKSYLEYLKRTRRDCFNITTDKSVWTKARNAWFSSHSQFAKYR